MIRLNAKDVKLMTNDRAKVEAQEPFNVAESEFNDAYIKAALQNLHVEFVGPKGSKTRLEKAALEIDFLRLDPVRVYNGLVRLALVGLRRAPDLQQISNVLKATNYVQKIVQDGLDNLHEDVGLDEAAENMFADPARVRGAWIDALSLSSAATVAVPSQLLPARSSTAATRARLGCTARAASKVRHFLSVFDACRCLSVLVLQLLLAGVDAPSGFVEGHGDPFNVLGESIV